MTVDQFCGIGTQCNCSADFWLEAANSHVSPVTVSTRNSPSSLAPLPSDRALKCELTNRYRPGCPGCGCWACDGGPMKVPRNTQRTAAMTNKRSLCMIRSVAGFSECHHMRNPTAAPVQQTTQMQDRAQEISSARPRYRPKLCLCSRCMIFLHQRQ